MPAYPMPSWLQAPDFVGAMAAGDAAGARRAQIAASAQEAQVRIQQASQEAAQDRAMKMSEFLQRQQMAKEDAERQAVKDGIDAAYQKAQLGLRTQEFELEKQKQNEASSIAARKFVAQQSFMSDRDAKVAEFKAAGMDDVTAMDKATSYAILKHGPAMGETGGPLMSAFRAAQPPPPVKETIHEVWLPESGNTREGLYALGSQGSRHLITEGKKPTTAESGVTKTERTLVANAMKDLLKARPWLPTGVLPKSGNDPTSQEDKEKLDQYNELKAQLDGEDGSATVPQAAAPSAGLKIMSIKPNPKLSRSLE